MIWSRVRTTILHRESLFASAKYRYRWELRCYCGCIVFRNAPSHGGSVPMPPWRLKCQALPGCKRFVNTAPEGRSESCT